MDSGNIIRVSPVSGIFSHDFGSHCPQIVTPNQAVGDKAVRIDPAADSAVCALGSRCAIAVKNGFLADFERTENWCARHLQSDPDQMVHVSTFERIDGMIYMTYYANTSNGAEDPMFQEARLAFCPESDPQNLTVLTIQRAGEMLDGRRIDRLYDTILAYRGGDELYLLWTASAEGNYYRFYCTYNLRTRTLSPIRPNRFRVGNVENDFSITGLSSALAANGIARKELNSDIGIMQKMTVREENGELWYYTGAYSWYWNCIIKSRDFITWEYVSAPDFPNGSKWENATYVFGDRIYYFVRQEDCYPHGFLTFYDLNTKTWAKPVLVKDAQSRSDFFVYKGKLYLIHAPVDRNGFGILEIDTENLEKTKPILAADMESSLFYPFGRVYGDELWLSYTVDRKHIRLSKILLPDFLG